MTSRNPLSFAACVVKFKCANLKDEESTSGTIVYPQQGIVISHGSIFTEFALKNEKFATKVKTGKVIFADDLEGVTFSVLLDQQITTQKTTESSTGLSIESKICTEESGLGFNIVPCEFIGAFRNKDFYSSLCSIMPDNNWLFNDSNHEEKPLEDDRNSTQQIKTAQTSNSNLMSFHLLSYFVVLKLDALVFKSQEWAGQKWLPLPKMMYKECHIGQTAELISTPFGALCPSVFFNSYSRGVICNISGKDNCWIITDARCIPGSEGCPLLVQSAPERTRYLSGIIASSLCWKNNEWIGFSVACSIESIHNSLLDNANLYLNPFPHNLPLQTKHIGAIDDVEETFLSNTVLVQVGSTWGSGIIIDRNQGIIVTCSHVVKDVHMSSGSYSLPVLVTSYKSSTSHPATIIYRQKPVKRPYDIAVIQCCKAVSHLALDWTLDISSPFIGQEVNVVGHAVFSTHLNLGPSLTKGVVSKVICHQTKPALLQTTCAVHPGVSGGPLLSSDGKLVGIAVCNTKDSTNNCSFPHVNMSVPFVSIWPVLKSYLLTQDKNVLSALEIDNSDISQLWTLGKVTNETGRNCIQSKL